MDIKEFDGLVRAAQLRSSSILDGDKDLDLLTARQELDTAYEELHAAVEELYQQSDEIAESQQRLEAERRRYQELFDFAPDGYLYTAPGGKILEANRAAAALLLVPQAILVGKPFAVYISPSSRREFRLRLATLQPGRIEHWEFPIQPRHGRAFQAAISAALVPGGPEQAPGIRWLFRDITSERQGEEALFRSKFLARLLGSFGDYKRLLAQAAALGVPGFADLCLIYTRGGNVSMRPAQVAAAEPETERRLVLIERRWPLDLESTHPAAVVMRTGKRRFFPAVNDELLLSLARGPRNLDAIRALEYKSLIALPLRTDGRMLGSILFASHRRAYGSPDLLMAETMARHISQALAQALALAGVEANVRLQGRQIAEGKAQVAETLRTIAGLARSIRDQPAASNGPSAVERLCEIEARAQQLLGRLDDSIPVPPTQSDSE